MSKQKPKKKENKLDRLFRKILDDKPLRLDVVKKDFEWFLPAYFHKHLQYPTAPFQTEIIKLLRDSASKMIVITAFRGSAKTTLVVVAYVLWAVFGVQQKKHILLIGQTRAYARRGGSDEPAIGAGAAFGSAAGGGGGVGGFCARNGGSAPFFNSLGFLWSIIFILSYYVTKIGSNESKK